MPKSNQRTPIILSGSLAKLKQTKTFNCSRSTRNGKHERRTRAAVTKTQKGLLIHYGPGKSFSLQSNSKKTVNPYRTEQLGLQGHDKALEELCPIEVR